MTFGVELETTITITATAGSVVGGYCNINFSAAISLDIVFPRHFAVPCGEGIRRTHHPDGTPGIHFKAQEN
ncbi:MAG: hypothetical protein NTV46_12935 [Verrucomicrobia bacterium]|nr:hypothetical protein [Verrucomicrobiota bacterium]